MEYNVFNSKLKNIQKNVVFYVKVVPAYYKLFYIIIIRMELVYFYLFVFRNSQIIRNLFTLLNY